MMKRFIIGMLIGFVGVLGILITDEIGQSATEKRIEAKVSQLRENSNGSQFQRVYADNNEIVSYKITEIYKEDIFGLDLKSDNGIYLIKSEVDASLEVGDIIEVVFNSGIDDDILSVKKLHSLNKR